MENSQFQERMENLERKVDLILEFVHEQRRKQQVLEDLENELYRLGKEVFRSAIDELDKRELQLDSEQVKKLFFTVLQNIETFNSLFIALRVVLDLVKDAYPIIQELIIDFTYELDKLQKSGVLDSLRTIFSNLSKPEFLQKIASLTTTLSTIQIDDQSNHHSLLKILKEFNSPEVKKGITFSLQFIKELSK
ncbi:MAG: hypothetical protein ACUVQ1_06235 [Candidatus Kapaibacteriales bacterium]